MNLTICQNCTALQQQLEPICPTCGSDQVQHLSGLAQGDAVYACGSCRGLLRLEAASNPHQHPRQYATNLLGHCQPQLPLETANAIFLCQACKQWNWITLDDRISGLRISCPDCLRTTRLESLGRKYAVRQFLKPVLLGDLRRQNRPLALRCGHSLFLARLLFERTSKARQCGCG